MIPLETLRPYQQEDVAKLLQAPAMGCFNEQRTGKTPTAIAVMASRNLSKVVVVCPASAIYPWCQEYKRWSGQPATALVGTPAKRKKILAAWEEGALVLSYGCLKTTSNSEGMVDAILQKQPEGIIMDEAHRFKTPNSKVAKAVFKTKSIPYRLALTGTPAPNKPYEIFSILHWLYPERFKSYWEFIKTYFRTYTLAGAMGQTYIDIGNFLPGRQTQLQTFLNEISTQRKRIDVMPWLPEKDRTDIKLPLTADQKRYLNELKKYFETEDVVVQGILDRLIRYRQICLAPELLDLRGSSPKTEWILDYCNDYPDTPTIIFSKFTSYLHLLAKALNKNKKLFGMITGEVSLKQRAEAVEAFQAGELNLLLINIDAGKEALTLDRGECIIFTDQYPPAADIQQAEDRFISTTEARANKPHRIIRLMMEQSYDEQMYQMVENRASLIDLINDYKKYLLGE